MVVSKQRPDPPPPHMPGAGVDVHGSDIGDFKADLLRELAAVQLRQDDLRKAESIHWAHIWEVQQEHLRELRDAEKDRLDAIRAVDVAATGEASRLAEQRASTLAKQTETMAETLRQQVQQTARESNAELRTALQPLLQAIEDLRRWQYESAGQKEHIVESRDVGGSRAVWIGLGSLVLFNTFTVILTIYGLTRGG